MSPTFNFLNIGSRIVDWWLIGMEICVIAMVLHGDLFVRCVYQLTGKIHTLGFVLFFCVLLQ